MSLFFYKTNLVLLTPELKNSILNSIVPENIEISVRRSDTDAIFDIIKLPDALHDQVLRSLPMELSTAELDPYIRVQYTVNGNISPHIDMRRLGGLLTVLTNDFSTTDFYTWKPTATKELVDGLTVANTDELIHQESVILECDKTYLFNHASVHDVTPSSVPRITLNITYQNLPYDKLVEIYSNLTC